MYGTALALAAWTFLSVSGSQGFYIYNTLGGRSLTVAALEIGLGRSDLI